MLILEEICLADSFPQDKLLVADLSGRKWPLAGSLLMPLNKLAAPLVA